MYNTYGTGNPALHALATSLDEVDKLNDQISDLNIEIEDLKKELAEATGKIACLEDDMTEMYDQDYVDSIMEDRDDYAASAAYWESEYDSACDDVSDLKDEVEELSKQLEDYKIIEERTGKSPEEIIEMFSTLQGTADFIKAETLKEGVVKPQAAEFSSGN